MFGLLLKLLLTFARLLWINAIPRVKFVKRLADEMGGRAVFQGPLVLSSTRVKAALGIKLIRERVNAIPVLFASSCYTSSAFEETLQQGPLGSCNCCHIHPSQL